MTDRQELHNLLTRELTPGEQILWNGHPDPQAAFRFGMLGGVGVWPFLAGMIFVNLHMIMGWQQGEVDLALLIFGLSFLALLLVLAVDPVWAARRARRTIYAITNKRLIIIEKSKPQIMDGEQIGTIRRRQRPDGRGSLIILMQGRPAAGPFCFSNILDVAHAERLVHALCMGKAGGRSWGERIAATGPVDHSVLIKHELAADEQLLWSGQPNPNLMLRYSRHLLLIWLVGVLWIVGKIGMLVLPGIDVTALLRGEGTSLIAIGVLAGIFVMLGSLPIIAMRQAQQTTYILTDRRLIRLTTSRRGSTVESLYGRQIVSVRRHEHQDGHITLLVQYHGIDSDGDYCINNLAMPSVSDVAHVEHLIYKLQHP